MASKDEGGGVIWLILLAIGGVLAWSHWGSSALPTGPAWQRDSVYQAALQSLAFAAAHPTRFDPNGEILVNQKATIAAIQAGNPAFVDSLGNIIPAYRAGLSERTAIINAVV